MAVQPLSAVVKVGGRGDVVSMLAGAVDLGLAVDVGAAAGDVTRNLRLSSDTARVVAFEPFPSNIPFFRQVTADLDGVTLIEKAVSDRVGKATFFVGSTVQGDENGWADRIGYSSVGLLTTSRKQWLMHAIKVAVSALRRQRGAKVLQVRTTTLDAEFPTETIDLLKIDVQGAERLVLAGAPRLLADQRIRVMYVEWSGDPVVERTLVDAGYHLYETNFVGDSPDGKPDEFEEHDFEVIGRVPLSVGRNAFELTYRGTGDVGALMRRIRTRGVGWIQTDLVALPGAEVDRILSAMAKPAL